MAPKILFLLLSLCPLARAQYNLNFYLSRALSYSPAIREFGDLQAGNRIQQKLNHAVNSAFQLSLSGDYLFTPYFNNSGKLVTTEPEPEAIGYDIALFDGGLYSAQFNLERKLFNQNQISVLDRQSRIQDDNLRFGSELEQHSVHHEVTGCYLKAWQALLLTRLAEETAANLDQQLTLTGSLVRQGQAGLQDYLLLRIESQNQAIARNAARQEYRTALYELNALAGIQDTTVVEIDSLTLPLSAPLPASRFGDKFRLDSLALNSRQEEFETRYRPELNLFVTAGLNAVTLQKISRKFGTSAGLSLRWPLYDGRQKSLMRQQTQLQQHSLHGYRQASAQNIALQLNSSRARIRTLEGNLRTYTRQLEDYRQLLQLSEKQLQQGATSMIDHLTLLRNYIEIRKARISAEIECQQEINNHNYWNW
ncbi:MAG TPA: TolC family protein [bacterium]|nr:TolC family protein [bacterium]HPR88007.1 TolC family protein [bacterium]